MSEPEIDVAGATHPGQVREQNEDQFLVGELDKSMLIVDSSLSMPDRTRLRSACHGTILCVADGLGGHAAGEVASQAAVDGILEHLLHVMPCFYNFDEKSEEALREQLTDAVVRAGAAVRARASDRAGREHMGTTLTLGYLRWPHLFVVHVGDSRGYLLHDGALRQITVDHTLAQRMVDAGEVSAEEAAQSRLSHCLWNAITAGDDPIADLYRVDLTAGDAVLFCTDGLTNHLSDERIGATLRDAASAGAACEELIAQANADGGSDNITVVAARFPAP